MARRLRRRRARSASGDSSNQNNGQDHHDLRAASRRVLVGALAITGLFMVVEVLGGVISGSLALIADAGHMLTDSASIALALFAIRLAKRPASTKRTYGSNRAEILAAGVNVVSLWLISGWIMWEAINRFNSWRETEVEGATVLVVGGIGMFVNIAVAYMLRGPSKHSINVKGALQHVMADIMGSVGVLLSGIIILVWRDVEWIVIVDPIISVLIVLLILIGSWNLAKTVLAVLMEGVPEDLDLHKLRSDMENVPGVDAIHDVHAWTVTSGFVSLTAHVLIDPDRPRDQEELLVEIRRIAEQEHGITHTTFQFESFGTDCAEDSCGADFLPSRTDRRSRRFSSAQPN